MRLAIFGDFNGNHIWADRLLAQSRHYNIDTYVCHGDIARKLSQHKQDKTRKCIDLLVEHNVRCCKGNHEEDILQNPEKARIDEDSFNYFRGLPDRLVLEELPHVLVTHKSPNGELLIKPKIEEFDYLKRDYPNIRIAFFGHSHIRFHHLQNGSMKSNHSPRFNTEYDVSKGLHLVNTGTTNMNFPFSFNIRPGYVIYDSETETIEFKCIRRIP